MKDNKTFIMLYVLLLIMTVSMAKAAIFDDQIPPRKAMNMIVDRVAMWSDEITIASGGTVEVDCSDYFENTIISYQGTNTANANAFCIEESATAGKFLVTGTASDTVLMTVWGKLDN